MSCLQLPLPSETVCAQAGYLKGQSSLAHLLSVINFQAQLQLLMLPSLGINQL